MEKKIKENLNLLIADGSSSQEYIDYLNLFFNVNVVDVKTIKRNSDIDLILFTGGADVNPQQYGEKTGQYTHYNDERDDLEINTFYKFTGVPKLGICRGAQLLTVLSKGKLIQHVENHTKSHKISIVNFGTFTIPSTHHQMMYPYQLPEEDYDLKAWSTNFLSTTYLNGNNQEIKLANNFLECEIIEYLRNKSLCIQGHPELGNDDIKNVTLHLINNFLKKFKNKNNEIQVDNITEEEYSWPTAAITNGEGSRTSIKFKSTNNNVGIKREPWINATSAPVWMTSTDPRNISSGMPRAYGTKGAVVEPVDPIQYYESQSKLEGVVGDIEGFMKKPDKNFYHSFDSEQYIKMVDEMHDRAVKQTVKTTFEKF